MTDTIDVCALWAEIVPERRLPENALQRVLYELERRRIMRAAVERAGLLED